MLCNLVMKRCDLIGKHAVFVHQETEAALLLQQSLFAAVGDKQLHVHLAARQRLHALRTDKHTHAFTGAPYTQPLHTHRGLSVRRKNTACVIQQLDGD